jgi:hypothetical protein
MFKKLLNKPKELKDYLNNVYYINLIVLENYLILKINLIY